VYHSIRAYGSIPLSPSCSVNGGVALDTPQPWGEQAHACLPVPLDGCGDTEVCIPKVPMDHELCIYAEGDRDCPAGYDVKRLAHRDVEDTRGCAPCECTPLAYCDYTSKITGDSACAMTLVNVPHDGSCVAFNLADTQVHHTLATNNFVESCDVAGGQPQGGAQVAADSQLTVCCRSQ
jgi:hypothetical protein